MSLSRKIAHNTLIQIAGKIVSTILGLFSIALITRYLGQSGFGEYTTIITFLTFFAVIADLGLTLVTVQMISGKKENENKIINNLFSFRLVSIIVLLCLAPIIVAFLPYDQTIKLGVLITAIYFVFPALNQILIGLFQKKLSMDRAALAEVIGRLALILGVLIAMKLKTGLNGILIATIISSAVSFVFHYLFAQKYIKIRLEFDWALWKKAFSYSWPIAITIVFNLIYLRADILILSLFKTSNEVGLYGAAYKIIDVLTTLPFMFAGLILPILTASWLEKNYSYFQKVMQKSLDVMIIAALPLIMGSQLLAKPVMIFIAGSEFAESGLILKPLMIGVAAIFIGTIFSHAVIAMHKQKKLIGFYAFTGISSLVAYLIFIPKFSYMGAAWVTVYSEIMIALLCAYSIFKYSHFLIGLKTFFKSLLASLFMGGFIYLLPNLYKNSLGGLLLVIILAIILYFLILYLLKGISPEDLEAILKKQKPGAGQSIAPDSNL